MREEVLPRICKTASRTAPEDSGSCAAAQKNPVPRSAAILDEEVARRVNGEFVRFHEMRDELRKTARWRRVDIQALSAS